MSMPHRIQHFNKQNHETGKGTTARGSEEKIPACSSHRHAGILPSIGLSSIGQVIEKKQDLSKEEKCVQ